jgi:hypothetical protein
MGKAIEQLEVDARPKIKHEKLVDEAKKKHEGCSL